MLCSLDDFKFETFGVDLQTIKRSSNYEFENFKLINAHDQWQSTAKHSKTIVLAGKLIKKSNHILDALETLAERKKEVTLAFDDGRASSVLILKIETEQSNFLSNGAFLAQDFEVTLGVIHGSV